AIRSTSGGGICASSGRSARTDRRTAASETVVASGPWVYMPDQSEESDALTVPAPGLRPTRPQIAAGERTEPNASVPWASGTKPAATAAALPPDDPPAVCVGAHGLRTTASGVSVIGHRHSSGTRVSPTITAPAPRRRATMSLSESNGRCGPAREPQPAYSPATAITSFTAIGTPASASFAR